MKIFWSLLLKYFAHHQNEKIKRWKVALFVLYFAPVRVQEKLISQAAKQLISNILASIFGFNRSFYCRKIWKHEDVISDDVTKKAKMIFIMDKNKKIWRKIKLSSKHEKKTLDIQNIQCMYYAYNILDITFILQHPINNIDVFIYDFTRWSCQALSLSLLSIFLSERERESWHYYHFPHHHHKLFEHLEVTQHLLT